jgi:hypothetical protein
MTVKEIVKDWLKGHGYEGLCEDECGCGLDDFAPCADGPFPTCKPAMTKVLTAENINDYYYLDDVQVGDTIYTPSDKGALDAVRRA